MKLSEVSGQGRITMIGDGYYLEVDPQQPHAEYGVTTFAIKRLMDEEEMGECSISEDPNMMGAGIWRINLRGASASHRPQTTGDLMDRKKFGRWCISKINLMAEDISSDALKARRKRAKDEAQVWLHRLNKDGSESGMNDAKTYFSDERAAVDAHNHRVEANPRRVVQHNLVSVSDFGTLKKKLVGKIVSRKGMEK